MSRASTLVHKIEILFHLIVESNNQTIKESTMAYYKQAGYMTEAEMKKQGKNETEKAKQRELNFTIRLEHYAKNNSEFDGPIYYIPIMIVNGVFQVNGCYCSPQCAVASAIL
jgi:DNA-directed RNA polymerase beta subunit